MAPPPSDYEAEEAMPGSLPDRGVRIHDHPNISFGTNRIHGLL